MAYSSEQAYAKSMLLSPAHIKRPSSPDHPWRTLLQEVENHLHNLGRIEQAISHYTRPDSMHVQEFALWETTWAEWGDEFRRTLRSDGNSSRFSADEDLRQIKLLLTVNDFRIEACRSALRAPMPSNVRIWANRKLSK